MKTTAVLIFDGDCGFCTSTANFLVRKTTRIVKAEAWQLTDLKQYSLTPEQTAKRVYYLQDQKAYSGAKAVARVLTAQKSIALRGIGYLLLVPPFSWLAIPGYALVAKYRHKLPGGTPACKL